MEKIAYTVAENGEYHDSGRYYTDIDDIRTAQYIWDFAKTNIHLEDLL